MLAGNRHDFFSSASPEFPWYRAWLTAVLRPSPSSYHSMVKGLNQSSGAPLLWVYVGVTISTGLPYASRAMSEQPPDLLLLCGPLLFGFAGVLGFLVMMYLVHWMSTSVFKAEGRFPELRFLGGSIYAPLQIVLGLAGAATQLTSYAQVAYYLLALYEVILVSIAVKAVYRSGWLAAMASVVPVYTAFYVCNLIT